MIKIATELQTSYKVEKKLMILNGYNAETIDLGYCKNNEINFA